MKTTINTLYATKQKAKLGVFSGFDTTTIKDENGNLIAIFPPEIKQPKRGQKFITLNCFKYQLNWI